MPKPSSPRRSETFNLELHRRFDELHSIISCSKEFFWNEMRLKKEQEKNAKEAENKWFWGFFILALILQYTYFENKAEWNLATVFITWCISYFAINRMSFFYLKRELRHNFLQLKILESKFGALTKQSSEFWRISSYLDVEEVYGDEVEQRYAAWINEIKYKLENYLMWDA